MTTTDDRATTESEFERDSIAGLVVLHLLPGALVLTFYIGCAGLLFSTDIGHDLQP